MLDLQSWASLTLFAHVLVRGSLLRFVYWLVSAGGFSVDFFVVVGFIFLSPSVHFLPNSSSLLLFLFHPLVLSVLIIITQK